MTVDEESGLSSVSGCENIHPGTVVMKQEEVVSPRQNGELQEKCLFVSEVLKWCQDYTNTTSCFFYHRTLLPSRFNYRFRDKTSSARSRPHFITLETRFLSLNSSCCPWAMIYSCFITLTTVVKGMLAIGKGK